jgi:segregation and condensation protein A
MAATLAHIKSKMLLPPSDDQQPDEDEELDLRDPRAELIRRLLEYQKYREAANELGDRSVAGRDVFTRSAPGYEEEGPTRLAEVGLFKLLDAFEGILRRVKDRRSLEVTAERIGIQERISQITDRLRLQRNCTFEELFDQDHTRYDVVVTFLALLEMAKLRLARVYQAEAGAAIHVQYALLDADAPTVPPPGESAEGAGSTLAESVADLRVTSDVVEGVEDAHAHEDEYVHEHEHEDAHDDDDDDNNKKQQQH